MKELNIGGLGVGLEASIRFPKNHNKVVCIIWVSGRNH